LNNIAIIEDEKPNYIGSTGFAVFNGILVDNRFLKVFLLSEYIRELYLKMFSGFNSPSITQEQFALTLIPLPTLSEQQKIVDFLTDFENDNLKDDSCYFNQEVEQKVIALHEAQLKGFEIANELTHQRTLLKNLRQQLLQDAVQGKLVKNNEAGETGQDLLNKIKAEKEQLIKAKKLKKEKELPPIKPEEIPFEIPEDWVWCRLGEIVTQLFDGPFGSHLKTEDYTKSGVQVIRLENLGIMKFKDQKETFVSQDKYQTIIQHTVYEGDIMIGSFLADGVKCVVLPKLKQTAIAKADCFTIRIKHEMLVNKYIMFLLNSNAMFIELSQLLRGMTRLRINTTQLKHLPIPLPPLASQHLIVEKLEHLMQICDTLENSIQTSARENEQLLQQVLREALQA
jgi:type I restriction enzyme S subunit